MMFSLFFFFGGGGERKVWGRGPTYVQYKFSLDILDMCPRSNAFSENFHVTEAVSVGEMH